MGRNSVPQSMIDQRAQYEVAWKRTGLTNLKILEKINGLDAKLHWGKITERQLRRDLGKYWDDHSLHDDEELKYLGFVQNQIFESMENDVLKVDQITNQYSFQPEEEINLRKTSLNMKIQFLDFRGLRTPLSPLSGITIHQAQNPLGSAPVLVLEALGPHVIREEAVDEGVITDESIECKLIPDTDLESNVYEPEDSEVFLDPEIERIILADEEEQREAGRLASERIESEELLRSIGFNA